MVWQKIRNFCQNIFPWNNAGVGWRWRKTWAGVNKASEVVKTRGCLKIETLGSSNQKEKENCLWNKNSQSIIILQPRKYCCDKVFISCIFPLFNGFHLLTIRLKKNLCLFANSPKHQKRFTWKTFFQTI